MFRRAFYTCLVGLMILMSPAARSQVPAASAPAPDAAPFALDSAQLDELLAPIALYPDEVLAQVLMASSYPLDIVEANRWNQQHQGWSAQALQSAAAAQPWDPSVKALLPFPQLLGLLDQNIGWAEHLGEAFLAQRADVADSVQRLRHRAQLEGSLVSGPEQQVTEEGANLVVAPTNTDVVYVPVYNPDDVYGPGTGSDYSPATFVLPPGGILVGPIYWCAPVLGANWIWGGWNWHQRDVEINLTRYNAYNPHLVSPIWGFVSLRRRGVPFHLATLRLQYKLPANPPAVALNASPDIQRLARTTVWQAHPEGAAAQNARTGIRPGPLVQAAGPGATAATRPMPVPLAPQNQPVRGAPARLAVEPGTSAPSRSAGAHATAAGDANKDAR